MQLNDDWVRPLNWGLGKKTMKEKFPGVHFLSSYTIEYEGLYLKPFPSDCGALTLTGANNVTSKTIPVIIDIASSCGFSKIFVTLVGTRLKDKAKILTNAGFRCVYRGKSNRNPHKDDYIFVYYNRNCKYKGY